MDAKKIGELIKKKRLELELTQNELASKLNITDKAISKWEQGLGCPDISIIKSLSNILGISAEELLEGEEKEDDKIKYIESYINVKSKEKENIEKVIKSIIIFLIVFVLFSTISTLITNLFTKVELERFTSSDKRYYNETIKEANKNFDIIKKSETSIISKEDKKELLKILEELKDGVNELNLIPNGEVFNQYKASIYNNNTLNLLENINPIGKIVSVIRILKKYDNNFSYTLEFEELNTIQRIKDEILRRLGNMDCPNYKYYSNYEVLISGPSSSCMENIYLDLTKIIIKVGGIHE